MPTRFWLIGLLLIFLSCEEDYFPGLDDFDRLLVIDGRITDEPGPYTIRLNYSSDVYVEEYLPVPGAVVTISDDIGNSEILTERAPGIYETSPAGIRGIAGRKYKIEINSPDGRNYASPEQELIAGVPIDTVTTAIEYRQNVELDYDIGGYQFYLEGGLPAQNENYYLWELEGTYKFNTDYLIEFIFQGGFQPYPNPEEFHTCWRTYTLPEVYTFSTKNLDDPQVRRFPLSFVDTEDRQLWIRFSLLTRQYSLSLESYEFWKSIGEQIREQGALHSRQPYQIRGNVKNIADETESVLGYFLVAGVSEKRIFVNPPVDVPFHFGKCKLKTEMLGRIIGNGDFVGIEETGRLGIGGGFCLDCRQAGGTIEKPDFWID